MDSPSLVLGPVLRHVGETTAAVWVQTDRPTQVEILGCRAETFTVAGHHYALVPVTGLTPGSETEYEVRLGGTLVWPAEDDTRPRSRIRTRGGSGPVRVVFGSCRRAKPDRPDGGADALDAYAHRMITLPSEQWPDALLMLGDQVYADDPTPQTRRWLASRRDVTVPPGEEVADFAEYAHLYLESWSDPEMRWLLSTVPTAMIFDDHDVRDDWNTSMAWREWITAQPWWRSRIRGGLVSYWVYQHLGNLDPEVREADPCYREVMDSPGDAWPVLERMADVADSEYTGAGMHRWSFSWKIDRTRVVLADTRCGRVLPEGHRAMIDDAEFDWLERTLTERLDSVDHLLVGSSLPWLMPPAISDIQSANEAACGRGSQRAEKLRQAADLEHWPAFRESFDRLGELLRTVASAPGGAATVNVASGDVHHSYAARAEFAGQPVGAPVHQLVCSPVNNELPRMLRPFLRIGWSRPVSWLVRRIVRRMGVPDPSVSWRRTAGPTFGNAIATFEAVGRSARVIVESPRGAGPSPLTAEFEQRLDEPD